MAKKEDKTDDIVRELLELPSKSLEVRIKQLEREIKERETINRKITSNIGTQELTLQDQLWRLRYVSPMVNAFRANRDFQQKLLKLSSERSFEQLSCFKDISRLKSELQTATQELEMAKHKLNLVKDPKEPQAKDNEIKKRNRRSS